MDGVDEWATASFGVGRGHRIDALGRAPLSALARTPLLRRHPLHRLALYLKNGPSILGNVLMALTCYFLVTPMGLVFKLIGRDGLERRFDPNAETHWVKRPRTLFPPVLSGNSAKMLIVGFARAF